MDMAMQCPGALDEAVPGLLRCSLGEGCEVIRMLRQYWDSPEPSLGARIRDAHPDHA